MISPAFSDPDPLPPGMRFLAGGGAATRLILDTDWSAHPLGAPATWPDILKATLSTVLNSPESMILAWGRDELSFFFNEAYFPLLGPRLRWAMGAPFRIVWADAWDQARPIVADAFAGRSQRFTDLPWRLDTDRGPADTWFTFSYSRILDPDGAVAGLFIFTNETTQRVLADAALRQSEERLRLVVEGARDHVIFTTDPDGIVTSWSAGAQAVLGWSPDAAIGRSASITFTPEDRAAGADAREIAGAARDGGVTDERWHVRQDGSRVFLNGSVHALPADAQGRPRGFIKVARDETVRLQARQELERLNATLAARVAQIAAERDQFWRLSRDPFVVCATDGRWLSASPVWTEILGWRTDELVGRTSGWIEHPDDRQAAREKLAELAQGRVVQAFTNRLRGSDRGYRSFSWTVVPAEGRLFCVARDVTDEMQRAAALRLYENIVRSDTAPVCAFDTGYRVIAFNQAHSDEFFRIFGRPVRIGDVLPDLFLPASARAMNPRRIAP